MDKQASSSVYAPFTWRAALAASLCGGLVFALLHLGLMWAVRGASPWVSVRMIAAIVLGSTVLSPLDTSGVVVLLAAVLLHGTLSIVYGMLLALLLPAVDTTSSIVIGGFYGLALYYINFYGFSAFSPWFTEERDTVSMVSHFAFGAVVAWVYKSIHRNWYGAESEDPAPARR
jgi:hypothetical protein